MVSSRVRKKGGALLGEGSYGCVFHPAIPCENEKASRKGVGKVVFDRKEANEEFAIMQKIQKIDPEGKYVNPILYKCKVAGPKMHQHDPDSKNCKLFNQNKRTALGSISQLIYKEKGASLQTYQASQKHSLFTIAGIGEYLNLAKGCELLAKHQLVHRDLKTDNIIRTEAGTLIMIDFGLSISFDEVFSPMQTDMLEAHYFVFPPEFSMCDTVVTNFSNDYVKTARSHLAKYSFDESYKGFKNSFSAVGLNEDIMRNQLEDYTEHVIQQIGSIKNGKEDKMVSIFKNFAEKIDVWGMGMVLLSGFINNKQQNVLEMNCWIRDEVARIIRGCLNVDPAKRFSSKQLVKELRALIKSNGVKPTVEIAIAISEQKSPQKPKTPVKKVSPNEGISQNKLRNCMRTHSLADLKTKMRERNLKVTGNKSVLCERLLNYVTPKKN